MKPLSCGVPTRSFLAPEYREASATVNQIFMIDLPTRARMSAGGKRLWVRALQRADHEADALSSGGADAGVSPTSQSGRSCLASWSQVPYGATDRGMTPRQSLRWQRSRVVTCECAGQAALPLWRSRVTRVFRIDDARGGATPGRTDCVTRELLIVPWGSGRSALHIGRREGDAVWHRRSDRRIALRGAAVKLDRTGFITSAAR